MEKLLEKYINARNALNNLPNTMENAVEYEKARIRLVDALGVYHVTTHAELVRVAELRISAYSTVKDWKRYRTHVATIMPLSATTWAVIIAAFVTFWSLAIYGAYKLFLEWIL